MCTALMGVRMEQRSDSPLSVMLTRPQTEGMLVKEQSTSLGLGGIAPCCVFANADLCLPQQSTRAASENGAGRVRVQLRLLPWGRGSLLLGRRRGSASCLGLRGSTGCRRGCLGSNKHTSSCLAARPAGHAGCSRCATEGLHFCICFLTQCAE